MMYNVYITHSLKGSVVEIVVTNLFSVDVGLLPKMNDWKRMGCLVSDCLYSM